MKTKYKKTYSQKFYEDQCNSSLESARICLKHLFERLGHIPESTIDFGCGVGSWLKASKELGVTKVKGIDGAHVPLNMLMIFQNEFIATDLCNCGTEVTSESYDLAICVEVAEHLPSASAKKFVDNLCSTSDAVLFSAAIPFQGGFGHINEQWPEYWASLFYKNGFVVYDTLRPLIWDNEKVNWWYRQNLLLFLKINSENSLNKNMIKADKYKLTKIHPEQYLINACRSQRLDEAEYIKCYRKLISRVQN